MVVSGAEVARNALIVDITHMIEAKIHRSLCLLIFGFALMSCNSNEAGLAEDHPKICKDKVSLTFDDYKYDELIISESTKRYRNSPVDVYVNHQGHPTGNMSGLLLKKDGKEELAYAKFDTSLSIGTVHPCGEAVFCNYIGPPAVLRSNEPTCSKKRIRKSNSSKQSSLADKIDDELVETVVGAAVGVAIGKKLLRKKAAKKVSKSNSRPLVCTGAVIPGLPGTSPIFSGTCR